MFQTPQAAVDDNMLIEQKNAEHMYIKSCMVKFLNYSCSPAIRSYSSTYVNLKWYMHESCVCVWALKGWCY